MDGAKNILRKYYPVAVKKSPYVILEPDEYTAMMNEECVKYTDADFTKIKSFSRMTKYIIIAWVVLAAFVILHQSFYRETIIREGHSNGFFHSIRYVFSSDLGRDLDISSDTNQVQEVVIETRTDENAKIFQGLETCTVGVIYKPDNCNSCTCDSRGKLACTKMYCAGEEESFVLL